MILSTTKNVSNRLGLCKYWIQISLYTACKSRPFQVLETACMLNLYCAADSNLLSVIMMAKCYSLIYFFNASQALVYNSGNVNLVIFSSLSSNGICYLPKTHQMKEWNNYILFTWHDRNWNYYLAYIWNYDSATCSVSVWSLSYISAPSTRLSPSAD